MKLIGIYIFAHVGEMRLQMRNVKGAGYFSNSLYAWKSHFETSRVTYSIQVGIRKIKKKR